VGFDIFYTKTDISVDLRTYQQAQKKKNKSVKGRIQGTKIRQNKKKHSYQGSCLDPQTPPVQGY